MFSRKIDRAQHGPSATEVLLGAVLSLLLGAAVAFAYLVVIPVKTVKELPKEQSPGAVYYIAGARSADHARQWLRKKQLFTEGNSVALNESELNAWIAAEPVPSSGKPASTPKPAPGPKPAAAQKPAPSAQPAAASAAGIIQLSEPNFRIQDGVLQIASQGTLNLDLFGIKVPLIVQVAGKFVKSGGSFVLSADRFYIGSCPLHRLPGLNRKVFGSILSRQKIPEDIASAWKKLADVSIEGNTLKLTMP